MNLLDVESSNQKKIIFSPFPLVEDMGRLDNGERQEVPGDWGRKGQAIVKRRVWMVS